MKNPLIETDPEIYKIIQAETRRLSTNLEMIPSENFVSHAVLEALGTVLTTKYAEGYPGKRYYGGCEIVDQAETLAIDRAKKLFNAPYANVQPHSGSGANMAVYFSILKPGDKILAMNLSHGGHLTHGSPVNFSGMFYEIIPYGVRKEDGLLDYDEIRKLAQENKPKAIVCGGSAYPRHIHFDKFREVADEVGAFLIADIAHPAGLIAAGLHPDPMPHCHFVTTTTHKTLRGPRGGMILAQEEVSKGAQKLIFPGIQGGPMMHAIAAKAVAFHEALQPSFKDYAKQVIKNCEALAASLVDLGFQLSSGGTDTHLVLIDLRNRDLTGKVAEAALDKAGITVNKNTVPFDDKSPFVTSGIRMGTPAITTRGMKEEEMKKIATYIDEALKNAENDTVLAEVKKKVATLCKSFPIYEDLFVS